jgi:type VI secretion system FHA domain protein
MTTHATLTLEVTGSQALPLGADGRKTFDSEGGTIGRAPGNRWVLTEGYVSGRHAAIRYVDGAFQIEDLDSRNGVFVNDQRIRAGVPHPLAAGDRIFIEPYEMLVSVTAVPVPDSDWGRDLLPEPVHAAPGDDWLEKLAPKPAALRKPAGPPPHSLDPDPRKEHVPPPVLVVAHRAAAPQIPPDYNPLAAKPPAERRTGDRRQRLDRRGARSSGATPAGAPGDASPLLDALLAGAGLEGVSVTPDVARQFGQILRVVVGGVLDVLRSRQEVKGEFRIRPTIIQRRRNNPLKHSSDVDDALHNLLLKNGPGYLGPVEAFEDAFTDLRNHQLAMLAGVQTAFEAMLGHFDPARLQKEFDRHTPRARGALAALQPKPDYWDFYRDWVSRLAQDPEAAFRTLFGHEFAKAYEEQLDRLHAEQHGTRMNGEVRGR